MLQLKINNRVFSGWISATVTRGLRQASATFDLSLTDRWDGQQWAIRPYDSCELVYNNQTLVNGYVDSSSISYDDESHDITVTGRSKTADLVDCSVASKQFNNQKIESIAQSLADPFGVKVTANVNTGDRIRSWKPDEGTSVFEAIEDLARLNALLITDNSNGDLLLTQAGTDRAPANLESGVNILSASGLFDVRDRFSDYIVKGQQKASDDIDAETAAHVVATIKDAGVTRYRPLILLAEEQVNTKVAQKRGQWEMNSRLGRSQVVTMTVQGWQVNNVFWSPNQLVRVKDPVLGVEAELLIASVQYLLDGSSGTTCRLELMPIEAFSPEPPDDKKKKKDTTDTFIIWKTPLT